MFKGRYDHAVDEKGRVSIPSRFRETVVGSDDDRIVLTYALDLEFPHIDAFPASAWRQFEAKLAAKPIFDPSVTMLKRLYVANAVECLMDSHGRILIPQPHRNHAQISKDVAWLGMTRILELWNPSVWQEAQRKAMEQIEVVRANLANFDL